MHLNDLDPARWAAISAELEELLGEIASGDSYEEYPDDCLQRRLYERLSCAALDALFCARGAARLSPAELMAYIKP